MADTKSLPVDDLVLNAGTQPRAAIDEDTVDDYARVLETAKKWPFPPIEVFHDGSRYLVSSGFHRTLASRRVERKTIPCVIHQGTAWDAFVYGIKANLENPLRPNAADKRHMIERLLDSGEFTQGQIAEMVGAGLRTVNRIASELRECANGASDDPFTLDDDWEDPFAVEDDTPAQRTPAEDLQIQRQKTVKTAEALARELCYLNELKKGSHITLALEVVDGLIETAKKWPKP